MNKTRVTIGIREDQWGFEAHVKVRGLQRSKRFPKGTALQTMQRWRELERSALLAERAFAMRIRPGSILPKSPAGWCYIYFVRDGGHVKIGRAENPMQRLRTLQTAHSSPLDLLAAIPAHAALEEALHARFAHCRQDGEWFTLNDELAAFINACAEGKNPVALIWEPVTGNAPGIQRGERL